MRDKIKIAEDIEILEEWIKCSRKFEKKFNLEEFVDGTQGKIRMKAIENLIVAYKELEKNNYSESPTSP